MQTLRPFQAYPDIEIKKQNERNGKRRLVLISPAGKVYVYKKKKSSKFHKEEINCCLIKKKRENTQKKTPLPSIKMAVRKSSAVCIKGQSVINIESYFPS